MNKHHQGFLSFILELLEKKGFALSIELREAIRITVIYLVFGICWIIFSDQMVNMIIGDRTSWFLASTVKGIIFVVLTALLIFGLIYPSLKKLNAIQSDLKGKSEELNQNKQEMQESEAFFRGIFEQAPVGIAIGIFDLEIIYTNEVFVSILGCARETLYESGLTGFIHPADLESYLSKFEQLKAGKTIKFDSIQRIVKPNGDSIWTYQLVTNLNFGSMSESKSHYIYFINDISDLVAANDLLRESERSKSVLLSNLPGLAYRCLFDRDWTMQFVSEGCYLLTGYKSDDLLYNKKTSFNDLIVPTYREQLSNEWNRVLTEKVPFRQEYEIITAQGERKWVLETGQGIYDVEGTVQALEGIIIDITIQKQREFHIKYLNEHDQLTGLYNLSYLEGYLNKDCEEHYSGKRAVILIYLHNFNLINLTYGYHHGEKIIKKVSNSLSTIATNRGQLFFISMGKLAFYVKDYPNTDYLIELCRMIKKALNHDIKVKSIKDKIGVIEIDNTACDAETVLKNVTIAAENVDDHSKTGYCLFDRKMGERVIREAIIEAELQAAIDGKSECFSLQYQPIIDIQNDRIFGFEALSRMKSQTLGTVEPMEFIKIAEKTQLIIPLGKKIMELSFDFLKRTEDLGYDVMISLNISPIQLLRDDFIANLLDALQTIKVNPFNVAIEVTESIFIYNYDDINDKLKKLRNLGIKVAIDDFGTGYSSLARGKELSIDCLKIDKFFMDKLLQAEAGRAISADIISMARKLGNFVIAEGVEHPVQRQYLIEHECDYLQGYLYSKPLDPTEALDFLIQKGYHRTERG